MALAQPIIFTYLEASTFLTHLSWVHFSQTSQCLNLLTLLFTEFAKSCAMCACGPKWSTCLRVSMVYVPTYQKRVNFSFYVPTCHTTCQCFNLACQRAIRRANSTLYFLSYLYVSYAYESYIKTVLYFISILYVMLKKSMCNFSFILLFSFFISRGCSVITSH